MLVLVNTIIYTRKTLILVKFKYFCKDPSDSQDKDHSPPSGYSSVIRSASSDLSCTPMHPQSSAMPFSEYVAPVKWCFHCILQVHYGYPSGVLGLNIRVTQAAFKNKSVPELTPDKSVSPGSSSQILYFVKLCVILMCFQGSESCTFKD